MARWVLRFGGPAWQRALREPAPGCAPYEGAGRQPRPPQGHLHGSRASPTAADGWSAARARRRPHLQVDGRLLHRAALHHQVSGAEGVGDHVLRQGGECGLMVGGPARTARRGNTAASRLQLSPLLLRAPARLRCRLAPTRPGPAAAGEWQARRRSGPRRGTGPSTARAAAWQRDHCQAVLRMQCAEGGQRASGPHWRRFAAPCWVSEARRATRTPTERVRD